MPVITFGSLFAGIGGLDLGFERAGLTCKFQVENDPYCIRVLQKHWPHIPRYGDVRKLRGSFLPPVDLLCGGFPCQPVSTAGRRKGTKDERWLWPEFARLVGEMGPRYVFVENVPGLLSKGGVEVVADLAEMGFDAEWGVVPASAVGAPHIRERVFILAHAKRSGARVEAHNSEGSTRLHSSVPSQPEVLRRGDGEGGAARADSASGESGMVADSYRQSNGGLDRGWEDEGSKDELAGDGKDVAESDTPGRGNAQEGQARGRLARRRAAKDLAPVGSSGSKLNGGRGGVSEWWAVEPDVGRVAYGIPRRVDRLRVLGNAVVPQWAELMGRMILEMDQ